MLLGTVEVAHIAVTVATAATAGELTGTALAALEALATATAATATATATATALAATTGTHGGVTIGIEPSATIVELKALELHLGHRLLHQVLDVVEVVLLIGSDEGDGEALLAGTARTADTVDVVLRVHGHVEVDDVVNVGDVDAAGENVGGNEDAHAAVLEVLKGAAALALAAVAVDGLGAEALTVQALGQDLGARLGAGEDDDAVGALLVEHVLEKVGLLVLARGDHELLDGLGSGALVGDLDELRVLDLAADGAHDGVVDGGGEEQGLTLVGDAVDDLLHVRPEAHVEHAVGLVEDENLDVVEVEDHAVVQVEKTAGGSDEHVDTAAQAVDLRVVAHAAHDGEHVVAGLLGHGAGDRVDLLGKLAGGGHDKGLGAVALLKVAELVEHRQGKGGSLAGTGLSGGNHVVTGEHQRNGLLLDGGSLRVAHLMDCGEDVLAKAEVFKSCHDKSLLIGLLRARSVRATAKSRSPSGCTWCRLCPGLNGRIARKTSAQGHK